MPESKQKTKMNQFPNLQNLPSVKGQKNNQVILWSRSELKCQSRNWKRQWTSFSTCKICHELKVPKFKWRTQSVIRANLAEPRGNLTLVTPTSKCICARILGTCLPADTDRVSGISYQGSTSEAGAEWQACAKAWRPEVSEAEPQTLPTAMPAGSLISVKGQVDPPWTTPFRTL